MWNHWIASWCIFHDIFQAFPLTLRFFLLPFRLVIIVATSRAAHISYFFCAVAFVSLSLSTCIFSVNFARFCLLLFGARKKCLRDFVWWAAVACLICFLVPIQPFILFQINRVCLLLFFSSINRKDKLNFIKLLTLRHKNERDACTEIAQHFFIRHKSIQISRKHVNWNSSTYANLTWFGYSMLWLIHEKIASNWIKCNIFAKSVQFTSPPSKKPFRSIRQLKKIKCKN